MREPLTFASIYQLFLVLSLLSGILIPTTGYSINYSGNQDSVISRKPEICIHYLTTSTPEIDGILDEPVWERATHTTGFTQRTPETGKPASKPTDVYIFYSDEALYVGAYLYDEPDSIAADLFRRDGGGYSDWFYVMLDSYKDRRTSYNFAVNPRGVRKDFIFFNDNHYDESWDAVWSAEAQIADNGWIVEMRIPLSQLRYSNEKEEPVWGINFQREIERSAESAFWAPNPPESPGFVSKFGNARGMENLPKAEMLEFIPYLSGKVNRDPALDSQNPFRNTYEWTGNIGGDLRYGLSSDFMLRATFNPDFGQVEVDPAVINLSAFETFFPEKRPFFL